VYRLDGSGTTCVLTQHLHPDGATGPSGNSAITFTASTTFAATELPGGVPSKFIGATNSSEVQSTIQTVPIGGHAKTPNGSIGYVRPDYSMIATMHAGQPAVAQVQNGNDGADCRASAAQSQAAMANVAAPAAGDASPADCVPSEANPLHNRPIVGFTTVDLAQDYANSTIGFDMLEYWSDFHTSAYMYNLLLQHGFSPLPNNLSTAIINNRFTQGATGDTDVMEPNVCPSAAAAYGSGAVVGR
jgi:phosphate transport system substrate-binding protein